MKKRGAVACLLLGLVSLVPQMLSAEEAKPQRLERAQPEQESFLRALLARDDVVVEGADVAHAAGAAGAPAASYNVLQYQAWALPDGATVEYAGIENREEKTRRNQELVSADGERPKIGGLYRGHSLCIRRNEPDGKSRSIQLPFKPDAVFGEIARVGTPKASAENGWVVEVVHSAFVFEEDTTRRLLLRSTFSLATLALVGTQEVSEDRFNRATGDVQRFQDGKMVYSVKADVAKGPEKKSFTVSGHVLDERQKPIQGAKVRIHWVKVVRLSLVSNRDDHFEEIRETDRKGYFEQKVKGGWCQVEIFKEGYLLRQYDVKPEDPPRTIEMVPLPVVQTKTGDFLGGGYEHVLGPLYQQRGFGLSLERAVTEDWVVDKNWIVGWTLNKNEADLWFEFTDEGFLEKYEAELRHPLFGDVQRKDWLVTVQGLQGTELMPAPLTSQDEGFPDWLVQREAPPDGYMKELSGLIPIRNREPREFIEKVILPSDYYVRKNGRYGKLIKLVFDMEKHLVGKPKLDEQSKQWLKRERVMDCRIHGGVLIQAKPLGHRLLFMPNDPFLRPDWALK